MTREDLFKFAEEKFSVAPEFPWDGETHAVLRHPQSSRWFAIVMDVKKKSLHVAEGAEGAEGEKTECIMNVKASPVHVEDLLHEDSFLPAWHMNKKFWVSVRMSMVSDESVKRLLEDSWDLVKPKARKRKESES